MSNIPTYLHVLIVDDDPIVAQVLMAFFAKHGVDRVLSASDGAEAISLLSTHDDVDLIIVDLHMPGADGIEFIQHLVAAECHLPLIIQSSANQVTLAGASILASAQKLNLIATLPKPVDFGVLEDVLGFREVA